MKLTDHVQKLSLLLVMLVTIIAVAVIQLTYQQPEPNLALEQLRLKYAKDDAPSVDHSEFEELDKTFDSPQQVTETCINCHTERHMEVMASNHWNWDRLSYIEGRGIHALGKRNAVNNYCIGVNTNEIACAKCHTGFGLEDIEQFDFQEPSIVDCLSCHDNSGEYLKGAGAAGFPAQEVDLNKVAKNVGEPMMDNCGACHFYGGGGNNVKHGDLEQALYGADRQMDVHMANNGINMTCVDCHQAVNHQIKGKLYSVSSANVNRLLCEDCHSSTPHLKPTLNTHAAKVSCQTCHIPTYAKENPTKMTWKWSDAGKLKKGQPYSIDDSAGHHAYLSIKGSFEWGSDLQPEYVWFNGNAQHYMLGDTIDSTENVLEINKLLGSHDDPDSKIIPVKIHRGDQLYDPNTKMLIQPKLYAASEGDSAFWKDFNWNEAASAGMKEVELPYSGEYDFIETKMYWPVNHMVSPANASLKCQDCHTRSNGRLAGLSGFYMPGRDNNSTMDSIGIWMIILVLAGVVVHGTFRVFAHVHHADDLEMEDYREFSHEHKEG